MTPARSNDRGFTLIELLIAMVVMTIAVVVLVGAIGSVAVSSQDHRGHATAEVTARDFGAAIASRVSFQSKLTTLLTAGSVAATVADASGFPSTPFYATIDQEAVKVTAVVANVLTLVRGQGAQSGTAHAIGSAVLPLFICASGAAGSTTSNAYGTFFPSSYTPPANETVSISQIDYWNGTAFNTYWQSGSYSAGQSCTSYAQTRCSFPQTDLRPDCDPGLERLTLSVAPASGDTTLRGITTTTQILLRTGSKR